jgi:hypothetical protein
MAGIDIINSDKMCEVCGFVFDDRFTRHPQKECMQRLIRQELEKHVAQEHLGRSIYKTFSIVRKED